MRFSKIHKSEGFVYNLFVQPLYLAFHAMFRRIEIFGKERIPSDTPLIIVANHPTAFVDPILFCTLFDEPMYNMTRGDIFEKPFANRLLRSMNMFPVYRARDGYGGSRRNQKVFDEILRRLKENKTMVIFVEGQHHLDTQLMPLQKGIVAIIHHVLQSEPKLATHLQILPIGVNYRYGERNWDDVSIITGTPFLAANFAFESNNEDKQSPLLVEVTTRLRALVHHLDFSEDQSLFDLGKEMVRSEVEMPLLPQAKLNTKTTFDREHDLAHSLNLLDSETKTTLKSLAKTYRKELKKGQFSDLEVYKNGAHSAWLLLGLILGCIPFILGFLGSLPIRLSTKMVVQKFVKKAEFITSIHLGVGLLVGLIWYILMGLIGVFSLNPYLMAVCLSLPILGWFTNVYTEWYHHFSRSYRWRKYPKKEELKQTRAYLHNALLGGV